MTISMFYNIFNFLLFCILRSIWKLSLTYLEIVAVSRKCITTDIVYIDFFSLFDKVHTYILDTCVNFKNLFKQIIYSLVIEQIIKSPPLSLEINKEGGRLPPLWPSSRSARPGTPPQKRPCTYVIKFIYLIWLKFVPLKLRKNWIWRRVSYC